MEKLRSCCGRRAPQMQVEEQGQNQDEVRDPLLEQPSVDAASNTPENVKTDKEVPPTADAAIDLEQPPEDMKNTLVAGDGEGSKDLGVTPPIDEPQAEAIPTQQPQPQPQPDEAAGSDAESNFSTEEPATPNCLPQTAGLKVPECLTKTNLSNPRWRKSCYFDATLRWGVKSFQPYNHMLLPTAHSNAEQEYWSLRNNVCLWDVAVERQIEVVGKDALQLAELCTPRGLSTMKIGECRYAMMTDDEGLVINDPVVLKLQDDRFWFSIADSDMLLWVKSLALGRGLDVRVEEAAVSPLAVQGPKSIDLVRDLFGDWVDELKFYAFKETELDGIPMLLARSGWSPERGYELYLMDESRGDELWEKVMAAGQKYDIMPGVPNQQRRIEGGLLVYGSDVTNKHNILELGLPPKWCSGDKVADFIGKAAIRRLIENGGPKRRVLGLEFPKGGDELAPLIKPWKVLPAEGTDSIGFVSSVCFSPTLETYIAIATVAIEMSDPGTEIRVETPGGLRNAFVRKLPFMPRAG